MDVSPKPSTTLSEMLFFLGYWMLLAIAIIQEVASICTDMRETPCSPSSSTVWVCHQPEAAFTTSQLGCLRKPTGNSETKPSQLQAMRSAAFRAGEGEVSLLLQS